LRGHIGEKSPIDFSANWGGLPRKIVQMFEPL
jgi:hypothetical protein